MLPGGGADLTISELQGLAARQQVAIETQHQALVARETRLKYLQQQQLRHRQLSVEEARLERMRERTQEKELEVKRVKATRGQVEQQRNANKHLNTELETLRARFSEQEKQMSMAGKRVESLLQQLDDIRKVKDMDKVNNRDKGNKDKVTLMLEKLRKEVAFHNEENKKKNAQLTAREQRLQHHKDEIARTDQEIEKLKEQQMKRRPRLPSRTQTSQQPPSNMAETSRGEGSGQGSRSGQGQGRKLGLNVAAVEPYIQHPPKDAAEDPQSTDLWKQDPKLQTLSSGVKVGNSSSDVSVHRSVPSSVEEVNNNSNNIGSNNNGNKDKSGGGGGGGEGPVEYKIPSIVSSHFGANRIGRGGSVGKGAVTGHQNRPGSEPSESKPTTGQPSHMQGSGLNSPRSVQRTAGPQPLVNSFGKPSSLPRWPPQPERGEEGGGGGEHPPPSPRQDPHINIYDEERQAGSGQSSPASSEGSGPLVKQGSGVFAHQSSTTSSSQLPAASSTVGQSSQLVHRNGSKLTPSLEPRSPHSGRQAPKPPPRLPQTVLQGPVPFVSLSTTAPVSSASSSVSQPSVVSASRTAVPVQDVARNNVRKPEGPQSSDTTDGTAMSPTDVEHDGMMIHLNQRPTPTYRYASKTFIANAYTRRLGDTALQRYTQLSRFNSTTTTPTNHSTDLGPEEKVDLQHSSVQGGESNTGSNNTQPSTDNTMMVVTATGPSGMTHFGVVGAPNYPDIASDKGSYKCNTPKQVRRRHSDSDNEELAKALQKRAEMLELEQLTEDSANSNTDAQPEPPTSSTTSIPSSDNADAVPALPSKPQAREALNKPAPVTLRPKPILKGDKKRRSMNRVNFDPLALLLDASLEGELDLVRRTAEQVEDVSTSNDEGITALHNAICAGHLNIVQFLIEFGADVNSPDTDGWTPLHCAASCNNLPMVRFLVDHGACLFATTISDHETAAEKCEEDEDGYEGCSDYLYGVQEKLGIANNGVAYAVFDYSAANPDELTLHINDRLTVIHNGDETEKEWWWAVNTHSKEGYIPRNLLGLYPRVLPANYQPLQTSEC